MSLQQPSQERLRKRMIKPSNKLSTLVEDRLVWSTQSRYVFICYKLIVQVEKQRFKIGSLDSLMELNETLVKVDQTLDTTTKKIERIATEMSKNELFIEVSNRDKKNGKPILIRFSLIRF